MILILRAAQVKEELLKYAQEAFGVNRNLSLFNTITMFIKFNQNLGYHSKQCHKTRVIKHFVISFLPSISHCLALACPSFTPVVET